jgi:hypothetical protein
MLQFGSTRGNGENGGRRSRQLRRFVDDICEWLVDCGLMATCSSWILKHRYVLEVYVHHPFYGMERGEERIVTCHTVTCIKSQEIFLAGLFATLVRFFG